MSTYTRNDVATAVNSAADMLDGLDPDTQTLIDFVVSATLTLLTSKDAGIEDVLQGSWEDDETRETIRDIVTGN
ncbi:MAG: hypothetical protein DI630_13215 [Gordonia sp. (in: high G+C Gram-positive bacteria)]|nr:MAG: hypothetical protein DI630_13215 [Gordonia sp. (in: high G+C Gram-positive bacteria)]